MRSSLTEEIRQAITIRSISLSKLGEQTIPRAVLRSRSLPVDVAFDVFLRSGEREWLISRVASRRGVLRDVLEWQTARFTDLPADLTTVDVILRANPLLADRDPETTAIWNGEIVFEDVVVERADSRR